MLSVYLPIAEMSVDVFEMLLLGGVTGILSGMFGVGGGFLLTPILIFMGIPPAVAVASSANQIIASSFSGFLNHMRRGNVDFRMGFTLLFGGLIGSGLGVWLFKRLQTIGQIDLVISIAYVLFLGIIGALMLTESIRAILRQRKSPHHTPHPHTTKKSKLDFLPFHIDYPQSGIRVSIIIPILVGIMVGVLVSLMGIGGGFFLIPAMLYILRMPAQMVVGTSLFQIIFVSANVTLLQAMTTHTVDIMLALLLMTGSVFGAQFGMRLATKFPTTYLRAILSFIIFSVAARLAYGLLATPSDLYSITLEVVS